MRTWDDLSVADRTVAVTKARGLLVSLLVEGVIEVEMPNPTAQKAFDKAMSQARREESMELAKELWDQIPIVSRELDRISQAAAEGALYDDNGTILLQNLN